MYLLKSILISTVIYLFYKIFLQKETFFQSIRWYFIIGIILSLLLPLLIIPKYVVVEAINQTVIPDIVDVKESLDNSKNLILKDVIKPIDWSFWLKTVYFIGAIFFFIKMVFELFSLKRLISKSKRYKEYYYNIVETDAEVSPFSFFNYIVFNKKQFNDKELKSIVAHEKVHVNQKHSLDILLVQLFVIVQWFNPFAWLYKKELQQNLEYIADKHAQGKAETHKKYQYLLLKTSIKNKSFALSNKFFNSQLKKRIKMLQKSQTKRINQLKYVLLLPLVAMFLYSFNIKEVYIHKNINHLNYQNKKVVIDVSHGGNDLGTSIDGYTEKELVLAISKKIADAYKGNASIIFTRNTDEFVSLNDRISKINTKKPDLVISLHINNAKDVRENGVAAYVSEKNSQFKQSKEVASLLLNNLTGINLKNNGISKANLKINSDVNCPSVTLELGYLSNKMDRAYLTSYDGQQEIARKIIDFINGKQVIVNKINFILPIDKDNIISISGYGMRVHPITKKKEFHKGVDFKAYNGMDVYAVASGSVTDTGYDDEKGYFITIEQKNGFVTKYHHLGNVQIGKGDVVSPGEIIGIIGDTGKSIAPHLHFELLKDGKNVNPMDYLSSFKLQSKSKKTKSHVFKKTNNINNKVNSVKNSTPKQNPILYKESKDKTENANNLKSLKKTNKTENNNVKTENTKFKEEHNENKQYKLDTIQKVKKPKENSGWISFENKTYFYFIKKNKISFYTRYGDDVVYNISLELLNKIKKEQNLNIELKQKDFGFIKYNGKTYFYYNKDSLIFYDKYGSPVKKELAGELSILLKNKSEQL